MLKKFLCSVVLALALCLPSLAANTQLEMLRDMFRRPVTEWRQVLKSSKSLLTDDFLRDVEKRVRWGIENNHIDDAFRFAMVGDFAAETRNKPANLRIDLADMFFKAGNTMMAGQICDNIVVTSPRTPASQRARFLRARLWETQKDLFRAHEEYVALAKEGHRPKDAWHKAGLISLAIQQENRAIDEFKAAQKAGNIESGTWVSRLEQTLKGDFPSPDQLPPIPNRPGINTQTGVAAAPQASESLTMARASMEKGKLDEARAQFLKAYQAGDKNPETIRDMAALYYRMGSLEEAKTFVDQHITSMPNDAELLRIRGNTLERMYDRTKNSLFLSQALGDYYKALQAAPNHQFLRVEYERATAKNKAAG